MLLLVISLKTSSCAKPLTPAEVERRIVGTWELVEWHFEGQILTPPVVNGRWQAHDGQAMSIYHRDIAGTAWDVYSYGTYSTNLAGWSYGWERRLEITRKGDETTAHSSIVAQTLFTPRLDGTDMVLDYQNGERRFVFRSNEFVYIEKGQIVRKWHRVKGGL
jgi:hypothetical protein